MGGLSFSKLLSWGVFNKGKWIVNLPKSAIGVTCYLVSKSKFRIHSEFKTIVRQFCNPLNCVVGRSIRYKYSKNS